MNLWLCSLRDNSQGDEGRGFVDDTYQSQPYKPLYRLTDERQSLGLFPEVPLQHYATRKHQPRLDGQRLECKKFNVSFMSNVLVEPNR